MKTLSKYLYFLGIIISVCGIGYGMGRLHEFERTQREVSMPTVTQEMRVTAYCPCEKCCGKWSDGFTACGYQIRPGDKFVAAPKNIAFGTMVYIPQYADGKSVEVLDRGGSIEGDRLDVFFPTHQEALNWGVKYLKVRIEP